MSDYLIENSSLKQIRKSIVSSLVGQLGSQSFNFALGLMLLTKTGSSLSFAASQVIGPIISLLFVPIVGPTVDRLSKKQVIAVSQIVTIIGLIGYALTLQYFVINILPPTLILITILAVSDQYTLTAYNAGAKGLVLDEHQTKLRGLQQSAGAIGQFIAPILGAALYSVVPFTLFVIIEVSCELMTLGIALSLNFQLNSGKGEKQTGQEDLSFSAGLTFFKKQKTLISLLILALFMNFCVGAFTIGIASVMIMSLKFSATTYGFVQSSFVFGSMLSGVVISQMKATKYPLQKVWGAMIGITLCLLIFGLVPFFFGKSVLTAGLIMLTSFILAGISNLVNVPFFSWLGEHIPERMQGRIFGLVTTFATALTPISFAIFGCLYDVKTIPILTMNLWIFSCCSLGVLSLYVIGRVILKIDLKHTSIID